MILITVQLRRSTFWNNSLKSKIGCFDEFKVNASQIVSEELRQRKQELQKQNEANFGSFKMPDVKIPKFKARSISELRVDNSKVRQEYFLVLEKREIYVNSSVTNLQYFLNCKIILSVYFS